MNENPFQSPTSASAQKRKKRDPVQASPGASCLLIAGFFVAGFFAGAVCEVGVGILLEETVLPHAYVPGVPRLSYGAMVLLTVPIAGILGGGIAASFAASLLGWTRAVRPMRLGAALLTTIIVLMIWVGSIQTHGLDASDIVLYLPLLIGAFAVVVWGILKQPG